MAKIPRQRTGSGGWPDRRRAVTYTGGKKGKGCAVVILAALGLGALGIDQIVRLFS